MSAEVYWRKDLPGHSAAVAAVARRFAQLYPENGAPAATVDPVDPSDPTGEFATAAESDRVRPLTGVNKVDIGGLNVVNHAEAVAALRYLTEDAALDNATIGALWRYAAEIHVSQRPVDDAPRRDFLEQFDYVPADVLLRLADWWASGER